MRTKICRKSSCGLGVAHAHASPLPLAESVMMTVGKDDTQKVLLKRAKNVFDRVKKGLKRAKI